jgi:hypothetical protein
MRKLFTKIFVSFRMWQAITCTCTTFCTYTGIYRILCEASTHISGKRNLRTDTHHLIHNVIRFLHRQMTTPTITRERKKHRKEVVTYKERHSDHHFIIIFRSILVNNTHTVNNEQRKVDST